MRSRSRSTSSARRWCGRSSTSRPTSQKGIVVGKGGRVVREIGTRARPELEALLGRRIFLELQVKVKEKWRSDERMLEQLGL